MDIVRHAFIDTETTGLDKTRYEMWELAILLKDRDEETGKWVGGDTEIHLMFGPEFLDEADSKALEISGYHARSEAVGLVPGMVYNVLTDAEHPAFSKDIAQDIAEQLRGVSLVGANPAFDAKFITAYLRDFDIEPTWHHRMIDVESMALQEFGLVKQIGLQAIAKRLEIDPGEAHTAMGDVETTLAVFETLAGI